jgi:tRNA dimethylallyltransferase
LRVGHAALVGSTASGKSAVAMAIATADPTWEIVTVDSMQVYRGMDIGTAKPGAADRRAVPHHLVDVADPWDDYDLATYQVQVGAALADIEARGRSALLVGGTALYLRAVVDGLELPGRYPDVRGELDEETDTAALHDRLRRLDPAAAQRMEPTNRRRVVRALEVTLGSGRPFSAFGPGLDQHPPTPFTLVALDRDRVALDARIDERVDGQLVAGWLDEVRALVSSERGLSRTASQALGYQELAAHLAGECTFEDAVDTTKLRTRRFSRRQDKWFRRDPRIRWVDAARDPDEVAGDVGRLLAAAVAG